MPKSEETIYVRSAGLVVARIERYNSDPAHEVVDLTPYAQSDLEIPNLETLAGRAGLRFKIEREGGKDLLMRALGRRKKPRQKPRQDQPRQDQPRQDQPRQDQPRQDQPFRPLPSMAELARS